MNKEGTVSRLNVDVGLLHKQRALVDDLLDSNVSDIEDLVANNIELLDGLAEFLSQLAQEMEVLRGSPNLLVITEGPDDLGSNLSPSVSTRKIEDISSEDPDEQSP
jgi:hypothetical protein